MEYFQLHLLLILFGLFSKDSVVGSLLSYETVKVVRVHDKRLSVLHYTFMLVIFAYIVGYVIVWQQRYLLTGVPTGSIRMTLKAVQNRSPTFFIFRRKFFLLSHGNIFLQNNISFMASF